MAGPRKVFRIEQTAAARLEQPVEATQAALRHTEIMRELSALRAALNAAPRRVHPAAASNSETARLTSELTLIAGAIRGDGDGGQDGSVRGRRNASRPAPSLTRSEHELKAVVNGTEQATQKILAAAEAIDMAANNLSAALDGKVEQALAQDIQDLVLVIFEACNFQDLIGQRIANVVATLKFIEDRIARVLDEITTGSGAIRRDGAQSLHGPKLDSDSGHAAQSDIDALFVSRR